MNEIRTPETKLAAAEHSRGFRWTIGLLVVVPLTVGGVLLSGVGQDDSPPATVVQLQSASTPLSGAKKTMTDKEYVKALIGRWQSPESYGKITLTLKPEGKGTMYVEFSTVYSLLVDDELLIDITWKVKDGRCVFTSIRGQPKAAFELVTKIKGTVRDQKIIKVTKDQAIFFDDKRKKTNKVWKRLKDKKKT